MPPSKVQRQAAINAALAVLPTERPELMAIGDSLFNGTRSLVTGRKDLTDNSVPVRVARGLGLWPNRFVAPDYPQEVLIDLEAIVRAYGPLDLLRAPAQNFIRDAAHQNATKWMGAGRQWSARACFDNVAIAGATTDDLLNANAASAWSAAQAAFTAMNAPNASTSAFVGAAAQFYFNINTAFLLNPRGLPELDALSQIDLAIARKPKRLIVSIGHNDGVFMRVLLGESKNADSRRQIDALPAQAKRIAERLKELPDDTHIYFNSLLKPSTVANLGPQQDALMNPRLNNKPGSGKYFAPGYHSKLLGIVSFSKSAMEAFDHYIRDTNIAVKAAIENTLGNSAGRFHYLNLWDFSDGLDSKHRDIEWPVTVRQTNDKVVELRNIPIGWTGNKVAGGLYGLDNMHPSGVGYQLMANHILRAIATTEGLSPPAHQADVQAAYAGDSLLTNVPRNWNRSFTGYRAAFSIAGALGLFKEIMKRL